MDKYYEELMDTIILGRFQCVRGVGNIMFKFDSLTSEILYMHNVQRVVYAICGEYNLTHNFIQVGDWTYLLTLEENEIEA